MGENTGLVWLLAAFAILLGIGLVFASSFDINANTFFSGVS